MDRSVITLAATAFGMSACLAACADDDLYGSPVDASCRAADACSNQTSSGAQPADAATDADTSAPVGMASGGASSGGASGGAGGSASPQDCADAMVSVARTPLKVMFVIDGSGSMCEAPPQRGPEGVRCCTSRG